MMQHSIRYEKWTDKTGRRISRNEIPIQTRKGIASVENLDRGRLQVQIIRLPCVTVFAAFARCVGPVGKWTKNLDLEIPQGPVHDPKPGKTTWSCDGAMEYEKI